MIKFLLAVIVTIVLQYILQRERFLRLITKVDSTMEMDFIGDFLPAIRIKLPKNTKLPNGVPVTTFGIFILHVYDYNTNCFSYSRARTEIKQKYRTCFTHPFHMNNNVGYRLACGLEVYGDYIETYPSRKRYCEVLKCASKIITEYDLGDEYTEEDIVERLLGQLGIPYVNPSKNRL